MRWWWQRGREQTTPQEPQEPAKLGPPPNWPDPVPIEWCRERQKRVIGANWRFVPGLVESSAQEIKAEIDESRAMSRARIAQSDAAWSQFEAEIKRQTQERQQRNQP